MQLPIQLFEMGLITFSLVEKTSYLTTACVRHSCFSFDIEVSFFLHLFFATLGLQFHCMRTFRFFSTFSATISFRCLWRGKSARGGTSIQHVIGFNTRIKKAIANWKSFCSSSFVSQNHRFRNETCAMSLYLHLQSVIQYKVGIFGSLFRHSGITRNIF